MAIFPALKPSTRTFTPGRYPHSEIPTLSGLQTRVRTSNVLLEQRLRLTFAALTEAEMLSIRSHYIGQQGRFLSFDIPSDLLSGAITPANFTPAGYSWIYANRPTITDVGLQRYDVSLELATVPPEGANINGAEFTVAASLAAGAATGTANTTGFDLTVTASLDAGAVGGDVEVVVYGSGFNLTVTISFAAGAADPGAASDPNFSSVVLLLHANGTNGSTTFTDSSTNAFTVTAIADAQISTAQSKFGGSSASFDGTGDMLSVADNAAWAFGSGDFTIEFWVRFNAVNVTQVLVSQATSLTSALSFDLSYASTGSFTFRYSLFGSSTSGTLTATFTASTNTWYHVAVTRSGADIKGFVDGTQMGSTLNASTNSFFDSGQPLRIGGRGSTAASPLNAYIDDLRITKGVARYTANFSPPTAAFPDA